MQLYIEGYRSHNRSLSDSLASAAWYYSRRLLGGRMARHIELDIKLTRDLETKEKAYGYCHIIDEIVSWNVIKYPNLPAEISLE